MEERRKKEARAVIGGSAEGRSVGQKQRRSKSEQVRLETEEIMAAATGELGF